MPVLYLCVDCRINATFVEDLRTFDISCTLSSNMLSCNSASTILPERTTCQTDDDPFPCKISSVILSSKVLTCLKPIVFMW